MRGRRYDPVKRLIDVLAAGLLLLLTAPVQAVVALLVRRDLGSPVIFRQPRPGRDGKVFELVKFRSMRAADARVGLVSDEQRLTRLGLWLRRTSLDELPTLCNVLRGDMSLVGPRPLLVQYLDRYSPEQARRHEVRPGVTGLAQVSGRNEVEWAERFRLDVDYVDRRSLALDARIIWATIRTVSGQRGISAEGSPTMPEFEGQQPALPRPAAAPPLMPQESPVLTVGARSTELPLWSLVTGRRGARSLLPVAATALLYAAVLHLVYFRYIARPFSSEGLGYRAPDPVVYALMLVWLVVVASALPARLRMPSDFLLWVLFGMAGAPSILLCQYNSHIPESDRLPIGLTVGAAMMIMSVGAALRPHLLTHFFPGGLRQVRRLTSSRWWSVLPWTGIVVVALSTQVVLIATSGIHLSMVGIYDVYSVRTGFDHYYLEYPLLGYLVPFTTNVVNPVLMARGLMNRGYHWFLLGAAGQYTLYQATGTKITLFSVPALLLLAVLIRNRAALPGYSALLAVVGTIVGSVALDQVLSTGVGISLVVRRFLIVPGALTAGYVAVFHGRPKTDFADSPLKWLHNPYSDVPPPLLVGARFSGDPTTSANASLFAHGYLALGFPGVLIEAAALVPVLWLLDRAARGLPFKAVALVLIVPGVALSGASVFTTILTHGLGAAVVVLAVLPRTGWSPRRGSIPGPDRESGPLGQSPVEVAEEPVGKRIGS